MTKADNVNIREVYKLIEDSQKDTLKVVSELRAYAEHIDSNVETTRQDVANIKGRIMYIPILISAAIGIFGIFISIILFIVKK